MSESNLAYRLTDKERDAEWAAWVAKLQIQVEVNAYLERRNLLKSEVMNVLVTQILTERK